MFQTCCLWCPWFCTIIRVIQVFGWIWRIQSAVQRVTQVLEQWQVHHEICQEVWATIALGFSTLGGTVVAVHGIHLTTELAAESQSFDGLMRFQAGTKFAQLAIVQRGVWVENPIGKVQFSNLCMPQCHDQVEKTSRAKGEGLTRCAISTSTALAINKKQ